jgi:hypothetical protein
MPSPKLPDPSVVDPWILELQKAAELPQTLMQGSGAMQKAREKWLPQNPHEFPEDYDYRLKTARLRNYFKRTVQNSVGKLFAKPFQVEGGLPVIQPICWDVDQEGTDIQAFAKDLLTHALSGCGLGLFLVDRGKHDGTAAADQNRATAPYWLPIPLQDWIALRSYVGNDGQRVISQLRYYRTIEREVNEFETEYVRQIRVVERDQWRVYEQKKVPRTQRTAWVEVDQGPNALGKVTLVPLYLTRTGFFTAENPLESLADMNLEHFQIRSEQRRSLQVNSFPILTVINYDGDLKDIVLGPNSIFGIKGEKSDVKFVESNGRHLEAARNELNDLVDQMRAFGASLDKPGEVGQVESASGRIIDAQDATTQLQLWALSLKDSIELGLAYTVEWLGGDANNLDQTGRVNLALDFTRALSESGVKLILEARKLGDLSRRQMLEVYRQSSLLPEDFNYERNDEELDDEGLDDLSIPRTSRELTGLAQ